MPTQVDRTYDEIIFPDFIEEKESYEDLIARNTVAQNLRTETDALNAHVMADGFAVIEKLDQRVSNMIMSPKRYSDIRKLPGDLVCIEGLKGKIQSGIVASIWGASILITRSMPDDKILIVSEWEEEGDKRQMCVLHMAEPSETSETLLKIRKDLDAVSQHLRGLRDLVDKTLSKTS